MSTGQASSVQDLIDALGRLPGIGPKSAQRIAYHLLKADPEEARRLAEAVVAAKEKVGFCERCFNLSEGAMCPICSDDRRDSHVLCVVEEPRDVVAVERTREYKGRYHVLGGAIDHLQGVGPEQLKIRELLARIEAESVTEVIICTNPNLEGEATALYLGKVLSMPGLTVSRIASGLPVGGDLEYADELTLGRALEGRRVVGEAPSAEGGSNGTQPIGDTDASDTSSAGG
ncbi:MAG: recombination mediator RecR [Microthrixaceae bacterium]